MKVLRIAVDITFATCLKAVAGHLAQVKWPVMLATVTPLVLAFRPAHRIVVMTAVLLACVVLGGVVGGMAALERGEFRWKILGFKMLAKCVFYLSAAALAHLAIMQLGVAGNAPIEGVMAWAEGVTAIALGAVTLLEVRGIVGRLARKFKSLRPLERLLAKLENETPGAGECAPTGETK